MHETPQDDAWTAEMASNWAKVQPNVTAYITACIPNFQDVEDLVQETAVAVARNFHKYDPKRSFLAWVIVIARNKVLDHHRRRSSDRHLFDHDLLERFQPIVEEMEPEFENYRGYLRECMQRLMPRGKKLLELRYIRELSPSQIAEQVGVTRNTVNVTLYRVRELLRKCVETKLSAGTKPHG